MVPPADCSHEIEKCLVTTINQRILLALSLAIIRDKSEDLSYLEYCQELKEKTIETLKKHDPYKLLIQHQKQCILMCIKELTSFENDVPIQDFLYERPTLLELSDRRTHFEPGSKTQQDSQSKRSFSQNVPTEVTPVHSTGQQNHSIEWYSYVQQNNETNQDFAPNHLREDYPPGDIARTPSETHVQGNRMECELHPEGNDSQYFDSGIQSNTLGTAKILDTERHSRILNTATNYKMDSTYLHMRTNHEQNDRNLNARTNYQDDTYLTRTNAGDGILQSIKPVQRDGLESAVPVQRDGLKSATPVQRDGLESAVPVQRDVLENVKDSMKMSFLDESQDSLPHSSSFKGKVTAIQTDIQFLKMILSLKARLKQNAEIPTNSLMNILVPSNGGDALNVSNSKSLNGAVVSDEKYSNVSSQMIEHKLKGMESDLMIESLFGQVLNFLQDNVFSDVENLRQHLFAYKGFDLEIYIDAYLDLLSICPKHFQYKHFLFLKKQIKRFFIECDVTTQQDTLEQVSFLLLKLCNTKLVLINIVNYVLNSILQLALSLKSLSFPDDVTDNICLLQRVQNTSCLLNLAGECLGKMDKLCEYNETGVRNKKSHYVADKLRNIDADRMRSSTFYNGSGRGGKHPKKDQYSTEKLSRGDEIAVGGDKVKKHSKMDRVMRTWRKRNSKIIRMMKEYFFLYVIESEGLFSAKV